MSESCAAITYRPGDNPAPCVCDAKEDSIYCYYHGRMADGTMTPYFEDARVATALGNVIYRPGDNVKRRKK